MGIFDLFRRRPDTREADPVARPENDLADLAEAARQAVLPGFLSRTEAIERVREEFELETDDPAAEDAVDRVWRARLTEEETWGGGDSDYQRVARAFAALNESGMIARMNFACCSTCGTSEIDDERTALPEPGEGYRYREEQYVFFHEQDSDRLVDEPAELLLTYSAWRAARDTDPQLLAAARRGDRGAEQRIREETDRKVGERVSAALAAEGLAVTWNGDPAEKISARVTQWRKPLPR